MDGAPKVLKDGLGKSVKVKIEQHGDVLVGRYTFSGRCIMIDYLR